MTIAIRHAWLQKHPSPSAQGGEFHWHPADRDRELRTSCVERLRGIEPPAVLWQLAPGHVAWAQLFAATTPLDRRRYVGVVLTIAEHAEASPAALLDALVVPPAAPWGEGAPTPVEIEIAVEPAARWIAIDAATELAAGTSWRRVGDGAPPGGSPVLRPGDVAGRGAADAGGSPVLRPGDVAGVARALLSGGPALVGDPQSPALPRAIAGVEGWMPSVIIAATRRGVWRNHGAARTPDPVAELVADTWREPGSRRAQAWQLLAELAAARGDSVDVVAGELTRLDDAMRAALTRSERDALGELRGFVELVHAWGRGRLDRCDGAGSLPGRLADHVALRALARLVDGRDASAAIAEVRWHALLPGERREQLLGALARRTASLRSLVERHHA